MIVVQGLWIGGSLSIMERLSINSVKDSYLAAAIKDGSQAEIKLNNIQTYGPIAMSYLKKDFYDANTITNIYFDDNEIDNISNIKL